VGTVVVLISQNWAERTGSLKDAHSIQDPGGKHRRSREKSCRALTWCVSTNGCRKENGGAGASAFHKGGTGHRGTGPADARQSKRQEGRGDEKRKQKKKNECRGGAACPRGESMVLHNVEVWMPNKK